MQEHNEYSEVSDKLVKKPLRELINYTLLYKVCGSLS